MEKESPKSNILKSPMFKSSSPKSPMPKSPIPKSPVAYEKYKSRCGYGLISFFNFRRCHSKKMISDTQSTSLNRNALGKDSLIYSRICLMMRELKKLYVYYCKGKGKNITGIFLILHLILFLLQ